MSSLFFSANQQQMVVVHVVAFCIVVIIITRIFVGLSQRERERERDVRRVIASRRQLREVSFSLLSDTKNIIFISFVV